MIVPEIIWPAPSPSFAGATAAAHWMVNMPWSGISGLLLRDGRGRGRLRIERRQSTLGALLVGRRLPGADQDLADLGEFTGVGPGQLPAVEADLLAARGAVAVGHAQARLDGAHVRVQAQ